MTQKISQAELKILHALEKLPFSEQDKSAWKEIIQENGVNEDLVKDLLARSTELSATDEREQLELARNTAELNRTVHSWRLEQNLRNLNNRSRARRR